jgi:hypothetical protein
VVLQVTQGGGVALASGEEVLVDAQKPWAARWMPLGELALEPAAEIALDSGGADAFPPAQAAAVDAIQMLLVDGLLERLAGTLAAQDAGQRLAGAPPAAETFRLGDLDLQQAMAQAPVFVADRSTNPAIRTTQSDGILPCRIQG